MLSRRPTVKRWRTVLWDGASLGDWSKELDGCDVVINLAGQSVNCRNTAANRTAICGSGVPAAGLMLEIGAAFMRTETELMLKSRRVVPGRLLAHSFAFKNPIWRDAAFDLYRQWKLMRVGLPVSCE
jgi:NAD dependent epimerase/dehydratase family enzyme